MKTININYSKVYNGSSATTTMIRNTFKEAMEELFIKPVFGANGELISNMTYIGSTTVGNYIHLYFDLNGLTMYDIALYADVVVNKDKDYGIYHSIIDASLKDTNDGILSSILKSSILCSHTKGKNINGDAIVTITIKGVISYLTDGTELKAIWNTEHDSTTEGVSIFDSITMISDGTRENIVGLITGSNYIYRVNQLTTSSVLSTIRQFNIDDKVYIEKVYVLENSSIVAFFDNIIRIFNNSLGTTDYTEGSYKKLIEVDGVRYRQLGGQYWIEDKD